jgi:hypothetical protein
VLDQILLPTYLFFLYLGLLTFLTCTEQLNSQDSQNADSPTLFTVGNPAVLDSNQLNLSLMQLKQLAIDLDLNIPKDFDRRFKKNWIALLQGSSA